MIRTSLKICLMISVLVFSVQATLALPACPSIGHFNNCFGTYTWDDGEIYTGEWKNNQSNGQGTTIFANGDNYVGQYKNNAFSGQGTFTYANGTVKKGIWKSDRFQYAHKKKSLLQTAFINLSIANRKKLQSNLKDLGLYTSSIDGLYGKGTAAALTAYNKKHFSTSDLKVTENVKKLMDKVVATAAKTITDKEAELFKQIKEDFGLNYYGGFIHFDKLPNTLFFFNDIQRHDSFEFRKALRNHDIELIVLSSPGGDVYEGLQTAGIIHDKNLKTYIPKKSLYGSGNCASACSFMFFAGARRSAEGDLGVHQFYSGKASDEEKIRATQKRAQFTVSEIIGFLNEFETPPWVFERMFQQKNMYYFKESELLQLETEVSEETKAQHEKAESLISDFRAAF
ncbi:MAG: hypothetical protein OSB34_13295, partial [Planktomarina sp.]|nr:hypothetical protein [Planktomarina sp.]